MKRNDPQHDEIGHRFRREILHALHADEFRPTIRHVQRRVDERNQLGLKDVANDDDDFRVDDDDDPERFARTRIRQETAEKDEQRQNERKSATGHDKIDDHGEIADEVGARDERPIDGAHETNDAFRPRENAFAEALTQHHFTSNFVVVVVVVASTKEFVEKAAAITTVDSTTPRRR